MRVFGRSCDLCLGIAVAVGFAGTVNLVSAEQITVAGSTTVKPIVDKAVLEYQKTHADIQFAVGAGGTGQGVKLAGGGEVQIGMASRTLKPEEKAAFPDLVAKKIGLDGIALVVHGENPVKQITTQQAKDVFTGKITNWKELGGNDAPIELISPNEKHGTFDGFREHFGLEFKSDGSTVHFKNKGDAAFSTTGAAAVDGNKPALAAVVMQPNGLGYVSLGAAAEISAKGAPVKMLDLDLVTPSEANVLNGKYCATAGIVPVDQGVRRRARLRNSLPIWPGRTDRESSSRSASSSVINDDLPGQRLRVIVTILSARRPASKCRRLAKLVHTYAISPQAIP